MFEIRKGARRWKKTSGHLFFFFFFSAQYKKLSIKRNFYWLFWLMPSLHILLKLLNLISLCILDTNYCLWSLFMWWIQLLRTESTKCFLATNQLLNHMLISDSVGNFRIKFSKSVSQGNETSWPSIMIIPIGLAFKAMEQKDCTWLKLAKKFCVLAIVISWEKLVSPWEDYFHLYKILAISLYGSKINGLIKKI